MRTWEGMSYSKQGSDHKRLTPQEPWPVPEGAQPRFREGASWGPGAGAAGAGAVGEEARMRARATFILADPWMLPPTGIPLVSGTCLPRPPPESPSASSPPVTPSPEDWLLSCGAQLLRAQIRRQASSFCGCGSGSGHLCCSSSNLALSADRSCGGGRRVGSRSRGLGGGQGEGGLRGGHRAPGAS